MAIRYPLVLNGTTIEELQTADSIDITSASISGDLTFTGTGARVIANFSDPTATNRLLFQTSAANSTTLVGIMPSGTGGTSGIYGVNSSNLTNASYFDLRVSGSGNDVRLTSDYYGAGMYLPITFYTGGLEQVRITANSGASADFQFSQSGTRITGDFSNATAASRVLFQTSTANSTTAVGILPRGTGSTSIIYGANSSNLTNASYFDLRVSGSGNDVRLSADYYGAGMYLPITFYTGGLEQVRITANSGAAADFQFSQSGTRITGDFSNGTAANRVLFQTSTANSPTAVGIMPRGTGTTSIIYGTNSSTLTNASYFDLRVSGSGNDVRLSADYYGAGTYLPITFYTGGAERVRIDTAGNIGQGLTSVTTTGFTGGYIAKSSTAFGPQLVYENATNDSSGPYYILQKGRAGAVVQSGDTLGNFQLRGFDGTNFIRGASIEAAVDGTPGTNDMPGRLVFSTTADGASTPTERMRIDSTGNVGIGGSPVTGASLSLLKNITGAATTYGVLNYPTILSGVTTAANLFQTLPTTQATAFTLTTLRHYYANSQAFGAGSAVTNQFGFHAESTLTGATNNYGFYSNIASASGRYNFYAAGTADNYFGGPVQISASSTSNALQITQTGTGPALLVNTSGVPNNSPFSVNANGQVGLGISPASIPGGASLYIASDGTTNVEMDLFRAGNAVGGQNLLFIKSRGTVAAPLIVANGDQLGNIIFRGRDDASNNVQGAAIQAAVDGTPGTNDMPGRLVFSTTRDGASSLSEAFRVNSSQNTLFGRTYSNSERIGIGGGTSALTTGTSAFGISNDTTVSSAQYTLYRGYDTYLSTQAAAFTLVGMRHYSAGLFTIGAGSAITSQYGFFADSSLTGATNNFGFYSAIASGSGRYNFYAAGTADNYFAGKLLLGNAAARSIGSDTFPFTIDGLDYTGSSPLFVCNSNNANPVLLQLAKSRGTTVGSVTIVASGDTLGRIDFRGADGTGLIQAATISAAVDGTPGTNDMPGRLVFSTTADGASSPTERMRIDNAGKVGIGVVPSAFNFHVQAANNSTVACVDNAGGTSAFFVLRNSASTSNAIRVGAESSDFTVYTNATEKLRVTSAGNIHGTAGTTTMTDGFFYIPSSGGAPTGVPTAIANRVPMYYDTTNNNFYVYNGAWKKVLLA